RVGRVRDGLQLFAVTGEVGAHSGQDRVLDSAVQAGEVVEEGRSDRELRHGLIPSGRRDDVGCRVGKKAWRPPLLLIGLRSWEFRQTRSEQEKPGVPTKASLLIKHQVRAVNSGAFEGVSEGFSGGCGDLRLCPALRCPQQELLSVRNAEVWGWARLCGPAPHRGARGGGSRPHPPRPAGKSGGLSRVGPPSRGSRRRGPPPRGRASRWGIA